MAILYFIGLYIKALGWYDKSISRFKCRRYAEELRNDIKSLQFSFLTIRLPQPPVL